MRIAKILLVAAMACLGPVDAGLCGAQASYSDTAELIKKTMASGTSSARMESYRSIGFEACRMNYNVLGTTPAGTPYDIKYGDIDFSSLNSRLSKAGHDYTAFVMLNFKKDIHSREDSSTLTIHTVVINVSDDERAGELYRAFLQLGELCGAEKGR